MSRPCDYDRGFILCQGPDILGGVSTPRIGERYRGVDGRSGYLLRQAWHAFRGAMETALRAQPPTRPQSDASHDLTVTIGEVGQKRAGRYEDVLTVEIRAAAP